MSATWVAVASAGWQQVNISRSRSSTTRGDGIDGFVVAVSLIMAACACRASRVDSRRIRSIARL